MQQVQITRKRVSAHLRRARDEHEATTRAASSEAVRKARAASQRAALVLAEADAWLAANA